MTSTVSRESIVQRQLDAYNARNIEALMATYTEDIELFEHPAKLLASGAAQVRQRHPHVEPDAETVGLERNQGLQRFHAAFELPFG